MHDRINIYGVVSFFKCIEPSDIITVADMVYANRYETVNE